MSREHLYSGQLVISAASRKIVPLATGTVPAITLNSVLFPAPLGPTTVINSPSLTCSERLLSAFTSLGVPVLNETETLLSRSIVPLSLIRGPATLFVAPFPPPFRNLRHGQGR